MFRTNWMGACGVVALGLVGCAAAPLDGGTIADQKVTLAGYAIEPGAHVRVQALVAGNHGPTSELGVWETLTLTTLANYTKASTTASWGSYPKYDRALYEWSASTAVNIKYYFDDERVFLRAQERIGSSWVSMPSFDRLGQECLIEHAVEANRDGAALNVQAAGIECSRDIEGEDLRYMELAKPGRMPDLAPEQFPQSSYWLVPDIFSGPSSVLFPVPGGPPAELLCGAKWLNVGFRYRNRGAAVMTRHRVRVAIAALGFEEIDEQTRVSANGTGWTYHGDVLFPPQTGRHATVDLASTVPNQTYVVDLEMNYDQAVPESDFTNNHVQVAFVRKCP